jgi:SpoVK/Ycf46/Vps4 family AAA+-type ATPase
MDSKAPIHLEDAGLELPAQRITTSCEWENVALDRSVREQVEDIAERVRERRAHGNPARSGIRALFVGPSGTGKTLAACLLGKATGLSVYRIDLAEVAAKYSGETEKNLAGLFERAQRQDWILYFDEADALFGKRTEVQDANDRLANQQLSDLLQRIEDFPGIVILATTLRSHLEEDFARRLQSILHFHLPDASERRT